MLTDVLHTVAKPQESLQGKAIDLASVPGMVESSTKWLKELKENSKSSKITISCLVILHNLKWKILRSQIWDCKQKYNESRLWTKYIIIHICSVINHTSGGWSLVENYTTQRELFTAGFVHIATRHCWYCSSISLPVKTNHNSDSTTHHYTQRSIQSKQDFVMEWVKTYWSR